MAESDWIKDFPGAITVTDADGIILSMNQKAQQTFAKQGGAALIGKSLFDCHPEQARAKLQKLLEDRSLNCYTIEKAGKKKLIYQSPWFDNGEFGGLVELSLELSDPLPHFIRKS